MGMLTQLAAATATKGTQRATRGGAFCGKKQRKVIMNIIVIPVKICAAVTGLKGPFQLLFTNSNRIYMTETKKKHNRSDPNYYL